MYERTLGLSAQAIAGSGKHHPWDPADLLRCMKYCESHGIDTDRLRSRMAGKSPEWDLLLPEWDNLTELLRIEVEVSTDGTAPRTYHEMKRVLDDGIACAACNSTGRGQACPKCKGTGRRGGGRCRAPHCHYGNYVCPSCHGNGHQRKAV